METFLAANRSRLFVFAGFSFIFLMPYPFADDFKVKWFLDVRIFHVDDAN